MIRISFCCWVSMFSAPSLAATIGAKPKRARIQCCEPDVNHDKKIDALDLKVFTELADAALKILQSPPNPIAVPLYEGMDGKSHELFAQVVLGEKGWDLSGLDPQDLRRLAVEATWLASQVQIILSFQDVPKQETLLLAC